MATPIGRAAGQPVAIDRPGGADHRLGAEPRGEDRKGSKADPQGAPGEQIVCFRGNPPRHEDADGELDEQVDADADQDGWHD
jgi:hypothetical protein